MVDSGDPPSVEYTGDHRSHPRSLSRLRSPARILVWNLCCGFYSCFYFLSLFVFI